jgi:hypothetical protein
LPQQPGERAGLGALGCEVGDCVQTNVIIAAAQAIKGVQPADRGVPLENADSLVVIGQANPSRQPRHAGPDDDRIVHEEKSEAPSTKSEANRKHKR